MTRNAWIGLIAAGMLTLATPKARGGNYEKLPSFRGVCEVRASLPGRMRLYAPVLAQDAEAAFTAQEKLLSTGVVREVTINSRIATALIVYDARQAEGAVIEGAFIRLLGLDKIIAKKRVSRAETGVRTLLDGIDHALMERTNGLIDGRMLTSGALAAAGLWKLYRVGCGVPGAVTLLWWASRAFRGTDNV